MNAIDTNVLIYAADHREKEKQSIARNLIVTTPNSILLWQVLCEYLAASRKLRSIGYTLEKAYIDIQKIQTVYDIVYPDWAVIQKSFDLQKKYNLSYWDSMVIAGAIQANATTLYSEDFDSYKKIESLTLINPFKNN